jgi:hypothetical protein
VATRREARCLGIALHLFLDGFHRQGLLGLHTRSMQI